VLTERRDYLLRLIQQASAAARRIRELLTGEGAEATDLVRDADQEISALLGGGSQAQLLERVDADTAVRLVGDAERIRAWIDLLQAQAEALTKSGAGAQAQRVQDRATALESAAARMASSSGP
jgi:hypothetical protein